jgi:hypothetical protein
MTSRRRRRAASQIDPVRAYSHSNLARCYKVKMGCDFARSWCFHYNFAVMLHHCVQQFRKDFPT